MLLTWAYVTEIKLNIFGRCYSKIRQVCRCRYAVSNETIPATMQVFFTKTALVLHITDIVLLDFWLLLLSWMFISSYTTIYFLVKKLFYRIFLSQWMRYSNVFECFFIENRGHQLSTYAAGGAMGGGSSKIRTAA